MRTHRKLLLLLAALSLAAGWAFAQPPEAVPAVEPDDDIADGPADENVASEQEGADSQAPQADGADQAEADRSDPGEAFEQARTHWDQKLQQAERELARLREEGKDRLVPLRQQLREAEDALAEARKEKDETFSLKQNRQLALGKLEREIKQLKADATYLNDLLSEFGRNFEVELHISELQRYSDLLDTARQAPDGETLSQKEVFTRQISVVSASLDRLFEALGGTRFTGEAVHADGDDQFKEGTFAMIGPVVLFRSDDGQAVGTVTQRKNSTKPSVLGFAQEEDTEAAAQLIRTGRGQIPLDPTLGNAHKIEATRQTLWEHISKGGPVMIPILGMAGAALLVVLYKWIALTLMPKPSEKKIKALLNAVSAGDENKARQQVRQIKGPIGKMLSDGVKHIREPRELIEEVMYETVLSTKLRLQRLLPFVAIAAASAPLLGLLGTVTGIINTFKLITVFGSGDAKMLSGGISEALITTEFGLIVAIPSLLLHAFLSRKARGMANQMEKTAIAFVNEVGKAHLDEQESEAPTDSADQDDKE
jgi:biopolymer transport protein ExbB